MPKKINLWGSKNFKTVFTAHDSMKRDDHIAIIFWVINHTEKLVIYLLYYFDWFSFELNDLVREFNDFWSHTKENQLSLFKSV